MNPLLKIVFTTTASSILLVGMTLALVYLIVYFNKRFAIMRKKMLLLEDEKRKEVSRAIVETREDERNKIASNLHDSIGAELSLLKLKLSKYGLYLKTNRRIKSDSFIKDIDQLDDTIKHVRSVCKELYAETIETMGLVRSCEEFVKKLNSSDLIKSGFKTTIQEHQFALNVENKKMTFLIFQEMMNNIMKHSGCSKLVVNLYSNSVHEIIISCKHNGCKFENKDLAHATSLNKGIGLSCMNKRLQLINGRINYLSDGDECLVIMHIPAQNYIETARIPLPQPKHFSKRRHSINRN